MTRRERIRDKYDGRCAYTGQPLGDDWQIDHATPACICEDKNDESNMMPCLRLINHYKRDKDVEAFRKYILTLPRRVEKNYPQWVKDYAESGKLPSVGDKRYSQLPRVEKWHIRQDTRKVKQYLYILEVLSLFGKDWDGKFYFEKVNTNQ